MGGVQLVVFDVDGVLTDGSLHYGPDGEGFKTFNARDGVAHGLLRAHGITTGVVSGKSSLSLDRRLSDLGIVLARTGRNDKAAALGELLTESGVPAEDVVYVGDDVLDLQVAGIVGSFYAPVDAHPLVLQRAHHVLSARGGRGVARETAEYILQQGGLDLESCYRPLTGEAFQAVTQ